MCSVRNHPSFYSMNPFITPNKEHKLTKLTVCQTIPMEREPATFGFMFICPGYVYNALANCSSD